MLFCENVLTRHAHRIYIWRLREVLYAHKVEDCFAEVHVKLFGEIYINELFCFLLEFTNHMIPTPNYLLVFQSSIARKLGRIYIWLYGGILFTEGLWLSSRLLYFTGSV